MSGVGAARVEEDGRRRGANSCGGRSIRRVEDVLVTVVRVFHRERGCEAVPERSSVGHQVGREHVRTGGTGDYLEVVGVEVEERGRATRGEASELDERLIGVDESLGAAELIDAQSREGFADALPCAGGQEGARGGGHIDAQEGAQGAVAGLGAGVDVDARQAAIVRRVAGLSADAAVLVALEAVLATDAAAEPDAGVRARDIKIRLRRHCRRGRTRSGPPS